MQASQKCTLNFFFYISLISLKMCWEFSIELQLTLLIFSFISRTPLIFPLLMYHSFLVIVFWKLREYVHNTEDFINIMLDDKQNKLLQMGVMLTTATLLLTAFIISVGYLSINVRIALFNDIINGEKNWLWTAGGGSIGCIVLYLFAYSWYKYKRLI